MPVSPFSVSCVLCPLCIPDIFPELPLTLKMLKI